MIRKQQTTEFEEKMKELCDYCEEQGIPIFIAGWQQTEFNPNSGYVYQYLAPSNLGIDIQKETGKKDRFPLFLKAVSGEWREF